MHVAVDAEEEADTPALAAEDSGVSAAALAQAELAVATAEQGLAGLAAATARGITHPESRRDATAAMHRESRPEGRFMVLARGPKEKWVPSSLLGRHAILAAITFHKINPGLALRVSLLSSRVIVREKIGISASRARARLQEVQTGLPALGLDRIWQINKGSTCKQKNDCATGRAKPLDGMTQNVIMTISGVIVIIMIASGGINIATLLFLSAGAIRAGGTAGGIQHGVTTRTIPTTITMARYMAMRACNQTR